MRNVLCQTNVFTTFSREATVAQLIFFFLSVFAHTTGEGSCPAFLYFQGKGAQ